MTRRIIGPACVALALLAACSVPMEDAPARIEPDDVPFRLLDDASPGPTAPTSPAASAMPVIVQFVRQDRLVGVRRLVPVSPVIEQSAAILDSLKTGPDSSERSRGLSTALPPGLELQVMTVDSGLATLSISGDTGDRSPAENILVVAQVVLSVTSLPEISSIQFTHDGEPVEALLADGALTSKPLTAADYATLRSR